MLMVVLGHNVEIGLLLPHGYGKVFYMATYVYHMPVFIFLQGYFSKDVFRDSRFHACAKKVLFFFWVYCIAKLSYYGGFLLVDGALPLWTGDSFWNEASIPWYMLSSIAFFILCAFFCRLKPATGMTVALLVGIFCRVISQIGTYLSLSRTLVFFPFFLMGYYLREGYLEKLGEKKTALLVGIGICGLCVLYLMSYYLLFIRPDWYGKIITILYSNSSFKGMGISAKYGIFLSIVQYIAAVISGTAFFLAVPIISTNHSIGKLVSIIGKNTLPIYVFHYPVLLFLWRGLWDSNVSLVSLVVVPCLLIFVLSGKFFSIPFHGMKKAIQWILK